MNTDNLKKFYEDGYVILKNAITHEQIDEFWQSVDDNISNNTELTYARYDKIMRNSGLGADISSEGNVARIIDIEQHSLQARDLILHPNISGFLASYYEALPTAIQTLTYKYSSQQASHSDLHLVTPPTVGFNYYRESLAAAWVACEDSNEKNGALIIYPGSHKFLKKPLQFFNNDYGTWVKYLDKLYQLH